MTLPRLPRAATGPAGISVSLVARYKIAPRSCAKALRRLRRYYLDGILSPEAVADSLLDDRSLIAAHHGRWLREHIAAFTAQTRQFTGDHDDSQDEWIASTLALAIDQQPLLGHTSEQTAAWLIASSHATALDSRVFSDWYACTGRPYLEACVAHGARENDPRIPVAYAADLTADELALADPALDDLLDLAEMYGYHFPLTGSTGNAGRNARSTT